MHDCLYDRLLASEVINAVGTSKWLQWFSKGHVWDLAYEGISLGLTECAWPQFPVFLAARLPPNQAKSPQSSGEN